MIMSIILQAISISLVVPSVLWTYLQTFIIALVYGLYGYFSSTGDGLPVEWNTSLIVKTIIIAILVTYAETQLGMANSQAVTWAQSTFNMLLGTIGIDKAFNGLLKQYAPTAPTAPPQPGQ